MEFLMPRHSFLRLCFLLSGLVFSCAKPEPLDPSLTPEQVVLQLLEDAQGLVHQNRTAVREACVQTVDMPSPEPGDLVGLLSPIFDEFQPYAARAIIPELRHPRLGEDGEPVLEPQLGYSIFGVLLLDILILAGDSMEPVAWETSTRRVSADETVVVVEGVTDTFSAPFPHDTWPLTVAFRLRSVAEGWRIYAFASPAEVLHRRRFDLEAWPDRARWRIRYPGDDLPITTTRAITLVVLDQAAANERRIGFRDGPELPADPTPLLSWLGAEPGTIEVLLTPGEGSTIQDVYIAIDALFAAGVTHLSLVTEVP
mgnify:CR=1 FL=1